MNERLATANFMKPTQFRIFPRIVGLFLLAGVLPVRAAVITWASPVNISGDADVSTSGILNYAETWGQNGAAVNGVTFAYVTSKTGDANVGIAFGSTAGIDKSGEGTGGVPYSGLSAVYKVLVKGTVWANVGTQGTVTLNNLTVSNLYQVQMWVNDSRGGNYATRVITLGSAGGSPVSLAHYVGGTATSPAGGLGQYVIGTFIADGASQVITVTDSCTAGAPGNQINSLQLRYIGTNNVTAGGTNGTWNVAASGYWSVAGNWSNGIPDGGYSADFSTLDITSDITVHLDSPRTVGNLVFGDPVPATAAGWILDNNSSAGNILTLTGAITVNPLGTGKAATISAAISGPAGLTKAGTGPLKLSGANTFSGGTTVGAGMIQVGNNQAFGANNSSVTIATNAALDVNGFTLNGSAGNNYNVVSVMGTGLGGTGAIINSGADQISALRNITLAGDATIGGTGRWDARAVTGGTATLAGNGYDLTKVGANYIAVVGAAAVASITGVKNINLNGGTLSLANNITVDNNTPGSIFINSSGFLDAGNWGSSPGVVVNKPIVLAGGTVETDTTATGAGGNATIAAGITLNSGGMDTIAPHSTSTLTLNGAIADGSTNALTFTGTGTTFLGAANTHDGTTTLNSGTLTLGNQNALQNSTLMMNGGTLVFDSSVTANVFILGGLAAGASGTGFDLALQNNAGTPIALVVGGNNTNTIYSGVLK